MRGTSHPNRLWYMMLLRESITALSQYERHLSPEYRGTYHPNRERYMLPLRELFIVLSRYVRHPLPE